MNEIVSKFLLASDKFMTEFTDFIYRNELDKACFQHDMAYWKSKDLAKRTQLDKVLRVIQNMMVMREDYLQWFSSFLIKSLVEVVLLLLNQIITFQMNFIGRLLENLKMKSLFIL